MPEFCPVHRRRTHNGATPSLPRRLRSLMLTPALLLALLAAQPPTPALTPRVDRERLMATLRELPASRAALGGPESVAGLDRTEALIVDRLKDLGYEARLESVRWAIPARNWPAPDRERAVPREPGEEIHAHRSPPRGFNNIIAELPGKDLAHEILLVGAHYDAAPGAPGADDNGTGVAALLELARVLKDRPLKRSVRLVFFTLEEVGLEGSKVHAKSYLSGPAVDPGAARPDAAIPAARLIGMISLEMLGYYTDAAGSQRSPVKAVPGVFTPPTVGDFLSIVTLSAHSAFCRRVGAAMEAGAPGLKTFPFDFLPVPIPDMLRSDHAPFLAIGVPALMLTDTANLRNPNYHRATDTPDTIDARRFTLAVQGLAAAVVVVAEPAGVAHGEHDSKKTAPGEAVTGR